MMEWVCGSIKGLGVNVYLRGGEDKGGGFVFFFFQAEDGIRDDLVTGVQTCALPISRNGQYKKRGRCRKEIRAVKNSWRCQSV